MSTDNLNQAIQLIQAGQLEQAQALLEVVLQANPQDLTAWSWYARTCRTPEKRIEALEVCLRFNPGNADVSAALEKLRAKVAAARSPAPAPVAAFYEPESSAQAADVGTYAAVVAPVPDAASASQPADDIPQGKGLDDNLGRPLAWYEVWLKALTQPNANAYTELLRDPHASPGRAYWWIFISGLIGGAMLIFLVMSFMSRISQFNQELISQSGDYSQLSQSGGSSVFNQLDQFTTGSNAILFRVILVWAVPLIAGYSVLNLMLAAAIYSLLARLLGGSGNYSRTVYLVGAYTAPLSMVSISMVFTAFLSPFLVCVILPVAVYQLWLMVVAIQAAHRMKTSQAFFAALLSFPVMGVISNIISAIFSALAAPLIRSWFSSLPH